MEKYEYQVFNIIFIRLSATAVVRRIKASKSLQQLLDDASIHVVGEFLINFRCLLVYRFVEWVLASFESLVEVQKGDIRYESDLYNATKFRHLTKLWIVYI